MGAFADAAHVARDARVVRQRPEREAVIGQHHQRRLGIHERDQLAGPGDRPSVHGLDRVAVLALLRRQLAGQIGGAEEVAEQVRGGVGALDVGHQQIGAIRAPEILGDGADSSRRWPAPI
ncbi:MAG: hypothetical protein U0802_01235 [Candidatus Binatia bacterium]